MMAGIKEDDSCLYNIECAQQSAAVVCSNLQSTTVSENSTSRGKQTTTFNQDRQ